jgi:hypothetical protein
MIVCIGRDSAASRYELYLRSLGYDFALVGSVDEYLRVTHDVSENIVLVSETFDPMSRQSVAHWVRHLGRAAKIIYLYEHHIGSTGRADAVAKAHDLQNVLDAIEFVSLSLPSAIRA